MFWLEPNNFNFSIFTPSSIHFDTLLSSSDFIIDPRFLAKTFSDSFKWYQNLKEKNQNDVIVTWATGSCKKGISLLKIL